MRGNFLSDWVSGKKGLLNLATHLPLSGKQVARLYYVAFYLHQAILKILNVELYTNLYTSTLR